MIEQTVEELTPIVGTRPACRALGVAPATIYRRRRPPAPRPAKPRPTPARALSEQERRAVLELLHGERFVDASPAQVWATLLDEGRYLLLAGPGRASRPYTSTDNPYSEAQFRTLKYRPGFPARFDSIEQARAFCRLFFDWYNHQHRHSGIGLMTPAAVHDGRARQLHAERARVLAQAYQRTPERFVRRPPRPPALPTVAWITSPRQRRLLPKFQPPSVSSGFDRRRTC